jgi:hypothetical protein
VLVCTKRNWKGDNVPEGVGAGDVDLFIATELADVGGVPAILISNTSMTRKGMENILSRPVLGVHGAVLRVRYSVTALHVRVDEAALETRNSTRTSLLARSKAAIDLEAAVHPVRHAHVSIATVAVTGSLDSGAILVGLDGVAGGDAGELVIALDV